MTRKPGTIAAGAVLIAAILGGTFGAALATDSGSEPAPRDVGIGYSGTASDVPASEPTPSTAPIQEAPQAAPAPAPAPSPTSAPAPAEETARGAADRAEKAASRAEVAADRAEDAATPEPAPATVPAPPAPECAEGEKKGIPSNPIEGRSGGWKECRDGKWVVTVEPHDVPNPTPTPDYGPKPTPSA